MAQTSPVKKALKADQAALVEGNNGFAVELYGQLRRQPGNLFFSPESISTALAMPYAGARGETAAEMGKTLHFTLPPERLHAAMGGLLGEMNGVHDGYQLSVANALWAQQGLVFLEPFTRLVERDYGAGLQRVDFAKNAEAARVTINGWVEKKTADKITDLLQPGVLKPDTRLVVTNAIYFKASWETTFSVKATATEDFHLSAAESVKTPLMHRAGGFNYFNGGSFQAVEIPYRSGDLSMIVLLPNEAGGLVALEDSLTAAHLQQWLGRLKYVTKVRLTLPKFKVTRQFGLGGTLSAMGMARVFHEADADFSGITGKRELFISDVIHKAYVDVDEQGTEAAAATAVMMAGMAMRAPDPTPPIEFRADHPFVFLIRDNRSGSVLFLGRVSDPAR